MGKLDELSPEGLTTRINTLSNYEVKMVLHRISQSALNMRDFELYGIISYAIDEVTDKNR